MYGKKASAFNPFISINNYNRRRAATVHNLYDTPPISTCNKDGLVNGEVMWPSCISPFH